MGFLTDYHSLIYIIAFFLTIVVGLPFIFKEIKKRKESRKLINRVIPVSSLTVQDIEKIETLHPEGKKVHPVINKPVCVGCGTCVMNCQEKDALYLVNGKSTLVNPFACKCRGDCERQCPTGALRLVEYGKKMKIRVPQVDEHFETNIKGLYIIGSLTGAGLIKEAINQGRAAVNHIMKDVFPDKLPRVLVVGAGPGGLSAMLSSRKFGLPVICLEKEHTANTIRNFPKKKVLMAEPVEMPLFGPLWVGDTTREELLEVWERILEKTGAQVTTSARLEALEKDPKTGQFIVTASAKRYVADKVILALGIRGVPRKLGVPGEESDKVFYNLLDAEDFAGSNVVIVGAGDSAVEAARSLRQQDCVVTIVVRGEGFPRTKTKNREKIEQAIREKEIAVYFNGRLEKIEPGSVTVFAQGQTFSLANDYVFVMVGGEMPFDLLQKIGVDIVEKEV